jgi:hypothetical protein
MQGRPHLCLRFIDNSIWLIALIADQQPARAIGGIPVDLYDPIIHMIE